MKPVVSRHNIPANAPRGRRRDGWALVVTALFTAVSVISFAIDQSVTLSDLPPPPAEGSAIR